VKTLPIGNNIMETLLTDIRYGIRNLLKRPGFTLIAVVTLALGIGANTAIFSVVNTVLLRPLPYENPDRLVVLLETVSGRAIPTSYLNFVDWRNQSTAFDNVAALRPRESFNLTGAGESERLQGRLVSANFLTTLGIKPIRGRDFMAEEDRPGATPVVILSHSLWQRRFGADENIIGKQLTLNNQTFTVIGITPANFQFGSEADVTVPIGVQAERFSLRGKDPGIRAVARLKQGIPIERAQAELNSIAARLEEQYPDSNNGRRVRVESLHENSVGDIRPTLLTLLGAVGFVLLISCANVANLLLTRAAGRHKEIAIRAALGASRLRILRQLFTESAMLAFAGGTAGLLLAIWGTDLMTSYLPEGIPRISEVGIDASVLGFTFAASLLTGVLFGLAPALQSSNPNLTETLKEGEDQAVFNVRTMEQMLSQSVAARRFSMILLAIFAALALILAAVGIYGVISYSVAQRTREVGIRIALGAQTRDVLKLVVRDGLRLVMIGVAAGLAGALTLSRLMTTLLFAVAPTDLFTYATVALGLFGVALLACYIPARRATNVDPLVALRYE